MLSPTDFNNAVPQFTNGVYASNPINPQYVEEPGAVDYNRGTEPLQTLPAQWWNWFGKGFTSRFNKLNIYVKNLFEELKSIMLLCDMSPSGTEANPTNTQLFTLFGSEYPKFLFNLIYPVGTIYWTGDSSFNPNITFGGTWTRIKERFIWAAGDSDHINTTGGRTSVTLDKINMPPHTHPLGGNTGATQPTFTGTAVTSGANNRGHTHSVTASGSISGGSYSFSGTAVTSGGSSATNTGAESSHTHSVGAHSHGLNSHTHGVGTIATGSGGAHTHRLLVYSADSRSNINYIYPPGSDSSDGGNYGGIATWCCANTWDVPDSTPFTYGSTRPAIGYGRYANYGAKHNVNYKRTLVESDGAHTHTMSGDTAGASGNTANSTAFNSGAGTSHSHTMAHTHSVTASGTVSVSTNPSFSGTAVTSGGESQNHTHSVTATGTVSSHTHTLPDNTGSEGGLINPAIGVPIAQPFSIMPPYIVKYCWERTA